MTRSITVETSNSSGKKENINLNYVNPTATVPQMQSAVTSLMTLTSNTYVGSTVTEKYSLSLS